MIPQTFALLHLNRWGDATGTLFPADMLAACIEEYPLDVTALAAGSAFIVGSGLDRAFGGSKHGDRTVTACVVKIVLEDEEHLFVLDADSVFLGRLGGIKSRFESYYRQHSMSRATLESYAAQDVADHCATQPYGAGVEVVQAWASGISANEQLNIGPDRAIALPQGSTFGFASPNPPIRDILSAIEFVMR